MLLLVILALCLWAVLLTALVAYIALQVYGFVLILDKVVDEVPTSDLSHLFPDLIRLLKAQRAAIEAREAQEAQEARALAGLAPVQSKEHRVPHPLPPRSA